MSVIFSGGRMNVSCKLLLPIVFATMTCGYAQRVEVNLAASDAHNANAPASAIPTAEDSALLGSGKTVLLDAWYNSQQHPDASGKMVYFHYKWNDENDSGFSLFGQIFNSFGAETKTLFMAPTLAELHKAQVYIIVSPDIPVKNPKPNYMQAEDAEQIAEWVKQGGVLMIMENDPKNADLDHLNILSEKFGIRFNNVLRNNVDGNKFEMGKIAVDGGGPIFHDPHTIFIKEICTITATAPATPALRDRGDTLMAVARVGKGTVFAFVDPWLYNEYTDGRKLPPLYDNYAAGKELVRWILQQVPR
jgi:unsaturated rhamnogalacturonyl hydrolase